MPLGLKLESARGVGDSLAAVVAAIDSGSRSAPDLGDRLVGVHLDAVEVHRDKGLLDALAILESGRAERDVVGVPFSDPIVGVVRGWRFVDDSAHPVPCAVAIEDLDLVAVLQVNAAVAARLRDEELDVQTEVAILLFRDD